MLLVDPDDGLTMEQVYEKVWTRLSEREQASILTVAAAMGGTWQDVITKCVEMVQARLQTDPLARQREAALRDWEHAPYGKDPRLSPSDGRP